MRILAVCYFVTGRLHLVFDVGEAGIDAGFRRINPLLQPLERAANRDGDASPFL